MDIEEALDFIRELVELDFPNTNRRLTNVEEQLIRGAWINQSFQEIHAEIHRNIDHQICGVEHLNKNIASNLWKFLSPLLNNEHVNKKKLRSVVELASRRQLLAGDALSPETSSRNHQYIFQDTIALYVENADEITKENLLQKTRVKPLKPESLRLFGLLDAPGGGNNNWCLEDLLRNLPQEINRKWLKELAKSVYLALRGELNLNHSGRNPREVPTFRSLDGKLFRPILHQKIEPTIDDGSVSFIVIFEEHISRGYVENAPNLAYATLLTALNLGSRLQLEVCNKYLPMLKDWSQEGPDVIKRRFGEVRISFEYIEEDAERRREGEASNKTNKERLRDSFESEDERQTIESNLSDQQNFKNILLQADTDKNIGDIRVALTELERLNKIVLHMIIKRLADYFDLDSP